MTEIRAAGSVGKTDPAAADVTQDADDNNSIKFKVKNFTSETNDNAVTTTTILNAILEDGVATRKAMMFLNRNVQALVDLLKDNNVREMERRY
jgi:hypothetical protein